MRRNIVHMGAGSLSYEIREIVAVAHEIRDMGQVITWENIGDPVQKGEEIPLAARIFAVIDVWDAVQSDRPYNAAWSKEEAIELIKSGAGQHFDPEVARVFIELVKRDEI